MTHDGGTNTQAKVQTLSWLLVLVIAPTLYDFLLSQFPCYSSVFSILLHSTVTDLNSKTP